MIFIFYFINFFEILTLNAQKGPFLGKLAVKYLNFIKKRGERIKMAFWTFKSQNLEKVYKININNHAI